MSVSLEKLCKKYELSYRYKDMVFHVIATCHYPESFHLVKVTPTQNNRLGILLEFPKCERTDIEDVDELCAQIREHFKSTANLTFDHAGGCFFVSDVVSADDNLRVYFSSLAHDCDLTKPLLVSIGKQGYCHPEAIKMSRTFSREMGAFH